MSRSPRLRAPVHQRRRAGWPPSKPRLEELIEQAIVDAYGESEQRTGFFTMMEENLALPFDVEILGVPARVERIDLTDADEIVAVCRRGRSRQQVPILDLRLPLPPPDGAEWIEQNRRWARGRETGFTGPGVARSCH